MPKNSIGNASAKKEKQVEKKVEKKLSKRFKVPPRMPSRGGQASKVLQDAEVQQRNWQQNRPTQAAVEKGNAKMKRVNRKHLGYLEQLLDPFNKVGGKIPDMVGLPTATFQLRGKTALTCGSVSGDYAGMIMPWISNTFIQPTSATTLANSFYNGAWTINYSNECTQLMNQFVSIRPVSGGLRVRNTDNLQNAKGTLLVGMYSPFDPPPINYTKAQDLYYCDEFPVIEGGDALWMPIHGPNDNPFLPTSTNFTTFGANTNPTVMIPSGYFNQPVLSTVNQYAGGVGTSATMEIPQTTLVGNVSANTWAQVPVVVPYAGLFFAINGATASQQFEIEWVWNFEGIPRFAGDASGVSPSPVDPVAVQAVAQVVANKSVTFTKKDSDPSFLDQILGFVDKAGRFVQNGIDVAAKVAPVIAQIGGMLL